MEPVRDGVKEASAPFDDRDADIILRSSDNVDFRVYRSMLSVVSPVWKTMLALPQNPNDAQVNPDEWRDGLPIVRLPEDSNILHTLLSLCHPRTASAIPPTEPAKCSGVLEAARKYDVDVVVEHVARVLTSQEVLRSDPLLAWAIATRFDMDNEIKAAARGTLRLPLRQLTSTERPEMRYVTGLQLCKLINYHERCSEATRDVLWNICQSYKASPTIWMAPFDTRATVGVGGRSCEQGTLEDKTLAVIVVQGNKWVLNYVEQANAHVLETPIGERAIDDGLMDTAIASAGRCPCGACAARGVGPLRGFAQKWAAAIDEAMAKVPVPDID